MTLLTDNDRINTLVEDSASLLVDVVNAQLGVIS